ncbi:MAG TPA: transglutaminase domain-containing protein [Polyangiaceae bacterium]|nr:transglutaminase domain-containing protein [Polyangiaceae bacterium]
MPPPTPSLGGARRALVASALALGALACGRSPARPQPPPPERVAELVDGGQFRAAEAAIGAALAGDALEPARREAYAFERERMRRIRLDFSLDRAHVKAKLGEQVAGLDDAEFDRWDGDGALEKMTIDGETRYFNRAASNLFRLRPDALARRRPELGPPRDTPLLAPHPHHAEARAAALAGRTTSVAPRRVRVTHSITVDEGAAPPGATLRAWLPYPRAIAGQQEDLRLVASAPPERLVAPESALQRTVYLEAPAAAGRPTTFSITYELTTFARYFDIDPEKVVPAPDSPELRPFVEERPPHVVFSDELRAFSRRAVGDETNPYRVARKLFDAVDRVPWAGAREYSTLRNIPDYVLRSGHGDCGQQTLLLIALLRLNGIPARWQSGWAFSDGDYDTMHDWGALYLAPYGWVPVDVTFGQIEGASPELAWFYFGGLDAFRVAFNDDYGRDFVPPKLHPRSETVDLQRGEVEWEGGNLYFDRWRSNFDWRLLPR